MWKAISQKKICVVKLLYLWERKRRWSENFHWCEDDPFPVCSESFVSLLCNSAEIMFQENNEAKLMRDSVF